MTPRGSQQRRTSSLHEWGSKGCVKYSFTPAWVFIVKKRQTKQTTTRTTTTITTNQWCKLRQMLGCVLSGTFVTIPSTGQKYPRCWNVTVYFPLDDRPSENYPKMRVKRSRWGTPNNTLFRFNDSIKTALFEILQIAPHPLLLNLNGVFFEVSQQGSVHSDDRPSQKVPWVRLTTRAFWHSDNGTSNWITEATLEGPTWRGVHDVRGVNKPGTQNQKTIDPVNSR